MENITIGSLVVGAAIGLEKQILGKVEQVYERTVLVIVQEYDEVDELQLIELQYKVLVKKTNILKMLDESNMYQAAI